MVEKINNVSSETYYCKEMFPITLERSSLLTQYQKLIMIGLQNEKKRESLADTLIALVYFLFLFFFVLFFFSNNIVAVFSVYIYAQRSTLRNGPQQLSVN